MLDARAFRGPNFADEAECRAPSVAAIERYELAVGIVRAHFADNARARRFQRRTAPTLEPDIDAAVNQPFAARVAIGIEGGGP